MKKILPIDPSPIIKTYPSEGNYLSILNANGFDTDGILINHYINIYYSQNSIGFIEYDYIKTNKFQRMDFNFSRHNLINKIKEELNNNHYVSLILNEYLIKSTQIQCSNNYCHDWLIYGYDDDTCLFKTLGYYSRQSEKNKIYGTLDISYNDILESAISALQIDHKYKGSSIDNHSAWINRNNIEEAVNPQKIRKLLKRYLKGGMIYKKQLFAITGEKAVLYVNPSHNMHGKDLRLQSYSLYFENKKIIFLFLNRCFPNQKCIKDYKEYVLKNVYKVLLLFAKNQLKPVTNINNKITELLSIAIASEKKILKDLIY